MNYYKHHLFFCTNVRPDNEACCGRFNSKAMYRYTKDKCRNLGLLGEGKITVSETRCLGRCELGPVLVVYPESVWYRWIDQDDIDEIIQRHLIKGQVVSRLLIE